jgi:peptidoglycan hydrolase CwlO-like protein
VLTILKEKDALIADLQGKLNSVENDLQTQREIQLYNGSKAEPRASRYRQELEEEVKALIVQLEEERSNAHSLHAQLTSTESAYDKCQEDITHLQSSLKNKEEHLRVKAFFYCWKLLYIDVFFI